MATQARANQVLRASANDNAPADPDSLAATIASTRQATASDFTRARIEGALDQGDVATATALTDRWGNDLLPADKNAVDQHLTYATFNQDSQQATTQAMAINQPAPSNTPLGRQRNADMVLHRSGGAAANDQVADADGQDARPQDPQTTKPVSSERGSDDEPLFPEGKSTPAYIGEEKVMASQSFPGQKLDADLETKRKAALAAVSSLQRPKIWPVQGDHQLMVQDGSGQGDGRFGWTRNNQRKQHQGIDVKAELGTPVYAVEDGVVKRVVGNIPLGHNGNFDYGNEIVIEHSNGITTQYAHLSPTVDAHGRPIANGSDKVQLLLKEGDTVKAGQIIGFVGNTGNGPPDHPQLHYEVRYGDGLTKKTRVVINPKYFLPLDN